MATETPNPYRTDWDFAIGEEVTIIGSSVNGHITARIESVSEGIEYKVKFYLNGGRGHDWYAAYELCKPNQKTN